MINSVSDVSKMSLKYVNNKANKQTKVKLAKKTHSELRGKGVFLTSRAILKQKIPKHEHSQAHKTPGV